MYTDKRRRYVLKVKRVLTPSHQAQSLATMIQFTNFILFCLVGKSEGFPTHQSTSSLGFVCKSYKGLKFYG